MSLPLQPPAIAVKFFAIFSRFEYALKAAGYVRRRKNAEADWQSFTNSLPQDVALFDHLQNDSDVSYLIESPPKQQIVNSAGKLDFEARKRPANIGELIAAVRRLRNNLFHGGKYLSGPEPSPERDKRLMRSAIKVLCELLAIANNVRYAFDGD